MSRSAEGSAAAGRSRRTFLAATGGLSLNFTIVPRHVLGGAGYVAPSEQVRIAGIGAGGMGGGDIATVARLGANIVALCDVDDQRAAGSFRRFPRRVGTKIFARCSTRRRRPSTLSQSAHPTMSTPSHRWPPSAPASTFIVRSRSLTHCTNAAS